MDVMTILWGTRLERSLAVGAGLNRNAVESLLKRYETLAAQNGPESAFRAIHSNFAAEDTDMAVAGIREELEKFAANHPGINASPAARLKRYVERQNALRKKLDIEVIVDEKNLLPHQREAWEQAKKERKNLVTLKVPEWAREKKGEKEYSAVANQTKLALLVKY